MQGLHLTADLYDCHCPLDLLTDAGRLESLCLSAVADAELTAVDHKFFTFPDYRGQSGGVTGTVLLAESHLAVHTWPERRGITLDVYVCNFSTDNSHRAEGLMRTLCTSFQPSRNHEQRIARGEDPGAPQAIAPDGPSAAAPTADRRTDDLLLEWLNADAAYGFRAGQLIESSRSPFQTIEVYDTPQFGKLFRLDGACMTSERDEFFYHEPLIHPAAFAHPDPRSALVIGGGDGGSTEELFKHPGMRRVTMAELDGQVIATARRHLQRVHRGALDDPRLTIHETDGFAFVRDSQERFDLIVLDLTDPDTPAQALYTPEFFELAKARLLPGGALTLHLGSPIFDPARVQRLVRDLLTVFRHVSPLGLYIPLYGSYWSMAVASDAVQPARLDEQALRARLDAGPFTDLQYYNLETHRALFAMPNYLKTLLQSPR